MLKRRFVSRIMNSRRSSTPFHISAKSLKIDSIVLAATKPREETTNRSFSGMMKCKCFIDGIIALHNSSEKNWKKKEESSYRENRRCRSSKKKKKRNIAPPVTASDRLKKRINLGEMNIYNYICGFVRKSAYEATRHERGSTRPRSQERIKLQKS